MWGLKKRLNSRRERRDLEIGVYLGRRRGSDVTSHVYWDISPAFLNPDFGTKAGKIRPFCEADLQGVRLPRPARCDLAGAQCGEPALARGQAASPNVDPAARPSLSGSQRPAAARRARRTRRKNAPAREVENAIARNAPASWAPHGTTCQLILRRLPHFVRSVVKMRETES